MDPTTTSATQLPPDDVAAIDQLGTTYQAFRAELGKAIIGQEQVIEQLAICLFARGHALLMGVPGLAKTLLVSSVAQTFDLSFNRIQFTPDLMPADITGTDIIQESGVGGRRQFEFIKGPVFANIVLADEINRAPAKTQSAMLEAMQENKVTVLGTTYTLQPPFFVLATQNPIEQEGTYPLPEAQLDRFLFNIIVDYPSETEEREIIRRVTGPTTATITPLMSAEDIIQLQEIVKRVPVGDHVIDFAAALARATRPKEKEAPDFVKDMVAWGAGPRAGIGLISAAKAHAVLRGRFHATTRDVAEVAAPVLRHRVLTTFNAEAAGITSDEIIKRLLTKLAPREDLKV
jgi:MoxR-like ATPase